MNPNRYYQLHDGTWEPLNVDIVTGEVHYLQHDGKWVKSSFRVGDKEWSSKRIVPLSVFKEVLISKKLEGKATDKQVGGSHYKTMKIQPGEFIRANNLGWYEGNALKYICRHKQKGGKQDIEKAIHYLELVLQEYDEQ